MSFWIVPGSFVARHALLLGDRDVERQQDRGGAVDREAGADLVERDAVEQDLGVGERVDRDADPADLLLDLGVVGVVAALRRQVERDRQARCRPGRAGSGSARWTPRPCRSPSTAGTSTACRGTRREVAAGERVGRPAPAGRRPGRPVRRRARAGCRRGSELGRSSMDNVLAKNENANTARWKHA